MPKILNPIFIEQANYKFITPALSDLKRETKSSLLEHIAYLYDMILSKEKSKRRINDELISLHKFKKELKQNYEHEKSITNGLHKNAIKQETCIDKLLSIISDLATR